MTFLNHDHQQRQAVIDQAWQKREELNAHSHHHEMDIIQSVLKDLDEGTLRMAEKVDGKWVTHEWLKKAVLMSFRLNNLSIMESPVHGYDKISSKFHQWSLDQFENAGFRVVPGALVRYGSYIAKNVVLMPSFTNIGAYIDQGTMIDIWATIGSCAQIGKNCHIAAGAVIGGVLEPVQANPVIVEDNCFVGAQSAVVEGMVIREGAVIGMGVMLGASTPIYNRENDQIHYGYIPPYSVVVAGILPPKTFDKVQTNCAVIVKTVDQQTRSRTAINDLLRL